MFFGVTNIRTNVQNDFSDFEGLLHQMAPKKNFMSQDICSGLFIYELWAQNSIGRHILNPTQSIKSLFCSWVVSCHFPSPWRQQISRYHTRSKTACSLASVCIIRAPQVPLQLCTTSASSMCNLAAKIRSDRSEGTQSTPSTSNHPFAQTATRSTTANSTRSSGRSTRPHMIMARRPSLRNNWLWRRRCNAS